GAAEAGRVAMLRERGVVRSAPRAARLSRLAAMEAHPPGRTCVRTDGAGTQYPPSAPTALRFGGRTASVDAGERTRRATTCEALDSWPPRACGARNRGEVMRSRRRPGEAPGHCWLVARQRALSVAFITARCLLVNRWSGR